MRIRYEGGNWQPAHLLLHMQNIVQVQETYGLVSSAEGAELINQLHAISSAGNDGNIPHFFAKNRLYL